MDTRDHGGNLDTARATYGGRAEDWTDLSTGINRHPYPVPSVSDHAWHRLPTAEDLARLTRSAAQAYDTDAAILPVSGAQAAIQLLPQLQAPGRVAIVSPTYNEHAAAFQTHGWDVTEVANTTDCAGFDAAVVVNPNNPDGQTTDAASLRQLATRVGLLIIDESFADPHPRLSCLGEDMPDGLVVLRSFGKFYGLAGLRLGFAIGTAPIIDRLRQRAGPWAVSGAAIEIGTRALSDMAWKADTIARLKADAQRLDQLADGAGWRLMGGTSLFRLYDTADASAAQAQLARHHVWSRVFPYSDRWIRLGLPGPAQDWARLETALG